MVQSVRICAIGVIVSFAAAPALAQELEALKTFEGHKHDIFSVAFSADGSKVASGSVDKTARIWDVKTGKELAVLQKHISPVVSVAFSPDGKYLATSDGHIRIWDWASGKVVQELNVAKGNTHNVIFSPSGKQVMTGSGGILVNPFRQYGHLTIWDVASRKELLQIEHPNVMTSMAFAPKSNVVVCGFSEAPARVFNLSKGKEPTIIGGLKDGASGGVALTSDGKTLVSASGFEIKIWDIATSKLKSTLKPGPENRVVKSVAVSPDGKFLAAGNVGYTAPEAEKYRIHLWNLETGKLVATYKGHPNESVMLAFSPDRRLLASASRDRTVKLWDVPQGK